VTDNYEHQLQLRAMEYVQDPLGFVNYFYPWGMTGTFLENEVGPDAWQEQILKDIGHALSYDWVMNNGVKVDCSSGIFIAVASGHGIGKSALMAMIDQWFMSTHPNPQVVTTANTQNQLSDKTWREMSKWHKVLLNRHWFEWTATKFKCLADPETWFSSAVPWSERRPEAFAGTHEKYVLIKFDEASAIPDIIFETTEGAMTDMNGIKIWILFGNPTRSNGRFAQCFKKDRDRWITYEIDSRESGRTDKKLIAGWEKLYGEDSDFFRVRVKGKFPRVGDTQFIGEYLVSQCAGRVLQPSVYYSSPKVLGVDVARFGDDKTVFIRRQGLAAFGLQKFRGLDTMQIASLVARIIEDWKPDAVFVDVVGIGAGVVDRLNQLGYDDIVHAVNAGDPPADSTLYFNKRVELWGDMKGWLKAGASIPDDTELVDDLSGPNYGFSAKEQFVLERKIDMKARGIASPDCADALSMTFAEPVSSRQDEVLDLLRRNVEQRGARDPLTYNRDKRRKRMARMA
jgi:hypothetical protein